MRIPTPSSVPSSLLSCPWKCVVSSLVRPQLTLRLWPRKGTLSWRRALQVAAPLASRHCANRQPYPPPRHPGNCASTAPSSVGGQKVHPAGVQDGTPAPRLVHPACSSLGFGKWAGRPLKNSAVGPREKNTMTVWDRRSGHSFLVDCGADESVLPASAADKRHRAASTPLIAANSILIKTWGKRESSILLSKGHAFTQEFHLADVTDPILGADFFRLQPVGHRYG